MMKNLMNQWSRTLAVAGLFIGIISLFTYWYAVPDAQPTGKEDGKTTEMDNSSRNDIGTQPAPATRSSSGGPAGSTEQSGTTEDKTDDDHLKHPPGAPANRSDDEGPVSVKEDLLQKPPPADSSKSDGPPSSEEEHEGPPGQTGEN